MAQVDLDTLYTAMKGKDTTNRWDALVAYDEDRMNKLLELASKREELKRTFNIDRFTVKFINPETDEESSYDLSMILQTPHLKFLNADGAGIRLTFPMKVTKHLKNGTSKDTDGLVLQIDTHLVNVSGSLKDPNKPATSDFEPAANDQGKKPYEVTLLDKAAGTANGICINMTNVSPLITATSTANEAQATSLNAVSEAGIKKHFREAAGLNFYLAGLSNSYVSEGTHLLKPTKFCFSMVKGTDNKPGALLMWIGVEGGAGSGSTPSENTTVTFHPNDKDLNPIPTGKSACVIFSHNIIAKYLQAALQAKKGFGSIQAVSRQGDDGMKMKLRLPSATIHKNKIHWRIILPGVSSEDSMEGFTFNVNGYDTTLNFGPAIPVLGSNEKQEEHLDKVKSAEVNAMRLFFSTDEFSVKWESVTSSMGRPSVSYGKVFMTFQFGGDGSWQASSDPKRPNMLKLAITVDSKFRIAQSAETRKAWYEFHKSESIPKEYQGIEAPVPKMDFELEALDYFLTTNLLLPGARVFKADAPSAKSLVIPRDMVLTGDVNDTIEGI